MAEIDDSVIEEFDLILNPEIDQQLFMMQFPLKPVNFDEPIIDSARIRARHKRLELLIKYHPDIFPRTGDQETEEAIRNRYPMHLKMTSSEVKKKVERGFLSIDWETKQAFLSNNDYVLQMRPCFDDVDQHRDAFAYDYDGQIPVAAPQHDIYDEGDDEEDDEELGAVEEKMEPVVHRKETERGYQKRIQRYSYKMEQEFKEAQKILAVHSLQSAASLDFYAKLNSS